MNIISFCSQKVRFAAEIALEKWTLSTIQSKIWEKRDALSSNKFHFGSLQILISFQENFYYTLPEQEALEDYNYDDPDATDWKYMQVG